jgi:hypothetical protein
MPSSARTLFCPIGTTSATPSTFFTSCTSATCSRIPSDPVSRCSRRPEHDLGADVRFAFRAFAKAAVRKADGERDKQNTDTDPGDADDRPRRPVHHI